MGLRFQRPKASDMVLVDRDGQVVAGTGRVNWPGFHIHQPILAARCDITSAAHTHTPWGTPFYAKGRSLEPITKESCIFFEDCALIDDKDIRKSDLFLPTKAPKSIWSCIAGQRSLNSRWDVFLPYATRSTGRWRTPAFRKPLQPREAPPLGCSSTMFCDAGSSLRFS